MTRTPDTRPELVLRLRGITKRFGALVANDAIDLDLHRGEVVALLGENGAGKTTLMSVLFGHYVADEGEVLVAGPDGRLGPLRPGSPQAALKARIGMVHQHFTLAENLSALDNIVLGTVPMWRPWQPLRRARERLAGLMDRAGLHVDLDARVGDLSVGERQRIEILKALYRDARILVLDEPTAVLTPQETDRLFETLRHLTAEGLAIIFISHKLAEVRAIADRVVVLRGGRAVAAADPAVTDARQLAELMVGRPVAPAVRTALEPGEPVLRLAGVSVPGESGRASLEGASLTVHAREIVGIAGVSGNGQSALAGLLAGTRRPSHGTVELFGRAAPVARPDSMVEAGVGRIPEDRHHDGIVGDMTLWENAILESHRRGAFQRAGFVRRAQALAHARRIIADYDVRCPGPEARARLLSGGNIQKLILGRVLSRKPRLILANQPTRGLDIGAVSDVHRKLLEACAAGAGVVLISEDLDELMALSDRIAVLHRGHLTSALPRERLTVRAIGLMMAGQSPETALEAEHAA